MDVSQVLGLDYVALLKGLGHEGAGSGWCVGLTGCDFKSSMKVFFCCAGSSLEDSVVRWCCISYAEQKKCEQWALNIKSDPLVCVRALSIRDCIEKIKVNHSGYVTEWSFYHCWITNEAFSVTGASEGRGGCGLTWCNSLFHRRKMRSCSCGHRILW